MGHFINTPIEIWIFHKYPVYRQHFSSQNQFSIMLFFKAYITNMPHCVKVNKITHSKIVVLKKKVKFSRLSYQMPYNSTDDLQIMCNCRYLLIQLQPWLFRSYIVNIPGTLTQKVPSNNMPCMVIPWHHHVSVIEIESTLYFYDLFSPLLCDICSSFKWKHID